MIDLLAAMALSAGILAPTHDAPPAKCFPVQPTSVQRGGRFIVKIPPGLRCEWRPGSRQLRSGDAEFGGNGPRVHVEARLELSGDSSRLYMILAMDARETGGNGTRIAGANPANDEFVIYTARPGFKIASYTPRATESFEFTDTNHDPFVMSPKALYRGSTPWDSFRMVALRPNYMRVTSANGLVDEWRVMGDSVGPDLGKTGVEVRAGPIEIVIQPRK